MCLFGNSEHRLKEAESKGYSNGYSDGEQRAVQVISAALTQQGYRLSQPIGRPAQVANELIQPLLNLLSDYRMATQLAQAEAEGRQTVLQELRDSLDAKRVTRLEAQITALSQALQTAEQTQAVLQAERDALAQKVEALRQEVSNQAKLIVLSEERQQQQH